MRPCDIDGHLAYHLTTFFEKGGMVTVFAFDEPVTLKDGSGWWGNVYWQVIRSREGKSLVLVARKKKALVVAQTSLGKPMGWIAHPLHRLIKFVAHNSLHKPQRRQP